MHDTDLKFLVQRSPIHGRGLFATRTIRKGEAIGRYDGPEVSEDGDHVLWVYDEDEEREYGIEGRNELRFVNHSGRPNANFDGRVLLALRRIRRGEEITHHYGKDWLDV